MTELKFDRMKVLELFHNIYSEIKETWYNLTEIERMEFYNYISHIGEELRAVWNNKKKMEPQWDKISPFKAITRDSE